MRIGFVGVQPEQRAFMKTPPFKTLVVEDHQFFRGFLCSTLEEKAQCQVIGVASDGLEAVDKAEQLVPDLIVLDLGLPKLNGIEVARRVCKICPAAKILIVSQDSSSDIVQAVLRLGAHGYLLKSDAADLPLAVDALLKGNTFLSSRLDRDNSSPRNEPNNQNRSERF